MLLAWSHAPAPVVAAAFVLPVFQMEGRGRTGGRERGAAGNGGAEVVVTCSPLFLPPGSFSSSSLPRKRLYVYERERTDWHDKLANSLQPAPHAHVVFGPRQPASPPASYSRCPRSSRMSCNHARKSATKCTKGLLHLHSPRFCESVRNDHLDFNNRIPLTGSPGKSSIRKGMPYPTEGLNMPWSSEYRLNLG